MRQRFVRAGSFTRGELVSTIRQPRLLLALVLGPFLVLFVFGLGYEDSLPVLSTVVVGSDDELADRVDEYIREAEPAEIDYQGTTSDEHGALAQLRSGDVDLVVVLPDQPMDTLGRSERAIIEIHQRSLDPVTFHQILIAARITVEEINQDLMEQVVAEVQAESEGIDEQLAATRSQLEAVQEAVDGEDLERIQRVAGQAAERFDDLADAVAAGGGALGRLGVGGDAEELAEQLRSASRQLSQLSEIDAVAETEDASQTLADLDEVLALVQGLDPAVAVRPFEPLVVSATPVDVTLERFYATGLIALMLQHLGVTFAALSLVRERERGMLDMLRVSPASTGERLAGKSVAFLLMGAATAAGLTALSVLVFDVPLPGSWTAFAAVIGLTLLASLGIGYLVAAVSRTHSQAVQYSMLLLLTAIFFTGLFMPLERIGMPVVLVSWLLPGTYGFVGLQHLMLLDLMAPITLYLGLGAIAAVTFIAARALLPRRAA
jgi:ABC-2 type transport system permease protein